MPAELTIDDLKAHEKLTLESIGSLYIKMVRENTVPSSQKITQVFRDLYGNVGNYLDKVG